MVHVGSDAHFVLAHRGLKAHSIFKSDEKSMFNFKRKKNYASEAI